MNTDTNVPLSTAELAALFDAIGGFEARPRIAVGVSGGPDSLALLMLADRWARRRGGAAVGLIVDHRLRPESAEEARIVAGWLDTRAIPNEVLVWSGARPTSGVQEAARIARYALLADWCRRQGVLHLVTAHHREDQAETYLIRRRAGSGPDGLAGMSAVRELCGCRLVRPLLSVAKARLEAFLVAERQPFLRDPSNLNPRFERARLRLAGTARRGGIASAIRQHGRHRSRREQMLDAAIGRVVALHPAGFAALDRAALAAVDAELLDPLLARVAASVGGARYPARRDRVARLRAGLIAEHDRARTLGGCLFVPWRGLVLAMRELAAASPPVRIDPGGELEWDRRFRVSSPAQTCRGFVIDYLGKEPAPLAQRDARPIGGVPRLAYQSLPVFRDDDGIAAVPHLGWRRDGVGCLPSLSFRPANPMNGAGFTVV